MFRFCKIKYVFIGGVAYCIYKDSQDSPRKFSHQQTQLTSQPAKHKYYLYHSTSYIFPTTAYFFLSTSHLICWWPCFCFPFFVIFSLFFLNYHQIYNFFILFFVVIILYSFLRHLFTVLHHFTHKYTLRQA